jgi:hypothetical protein
MDIVKKLMRDTVIAEAGIIPIRATPIDMNREMASLTPEEQRVAKRKFRKMWRRAAKRAMREARNGRDAGRVADRLGFAHCGGVAPTKRQQLNRKSAVMTEISLATDRLLAAAREAQLRSSGSYGQ